MSAKYYCLATLGLIFANLAFATEAPKAKVKGFYYDTATKKYYTDGKAGFSIRPVGKADYLEKIEVSINDGSFTTYNGTLKLDQEGHYNIRFRAVDPVLNWSPIQIYDIYVDRAAPITRWTLNGTNISREGMYYIHPQTKLVLSGEDALSGISQTWLVNDAGSASPVGESLTFKAGAHKLKFYSSDRVGNIENVQELNLVVDGDAPKTEVGIAGVEHRVGDRLYVHYDGRLALKSTDNASGVKNIEYQINTGPVVTYSAPIAVSEKKLTLKYRAFDNVGNAENWQTIAILEDNIAPHLSLKEEGRYIIGHGKTFARSGFKLKINATDDESGLKSILTSSDGKEFAPLTNKEVSFDKPGDYTLQVRAADNLGNMSEANPLVLHIDDTAPTTTPKFTENAVQRDDKFLVALPNRLNFSAEDNGAGVDHIEYSLDGKTYQTLKEPIDLSTWKNNVQLVHYRAIDRLGNVEPAKNIKVELLNSGPMVGLFIESESHPDVPLSKLTDSSAPREPAKSVSPAKTNTQKKAK